MIEKFPILELCQKYNWQWAYYDMLDPHWNFKKEVPLNNLGTFSEGMEAYNEVVKMVVDWAEKYNVPNTVMTKKCYPSRSRQGDENLVWKNSISWYRWDSRALSYLVILSHGYALRLIIGKDKKDTMGGNIALLQLSNELEKDGHNINDYATPYEEACEIKDNMPSPRKELTQFGKWMRGSYINNVHHIDLNSAYPSGIIESYPELTDTFTRLYNKRKENPKYKDIMNYSIGMMHSDVIHYKYVKLAYAALSHTRKELERITKEMAKHPDKYKIINYNTDGLFYTGDIYHDEYEGNNLGQWKHDHINVTASFKSAAAYEYYENGKWDVVYSGWTSLDAIKKREDWDKGDIYKTIPYHLKKTTDKYHTYYWERYYD